jgi:cyclic pyranopterin phosphate synthase
LKGFNEDEALGLVKWAHGRGFDLTFIEVMPLGAMEPDRSDQFLPLTELRARLQDSLTLVPSTYVTSGPARYYDIEETGGRLGFITPLTHNFCESCNRVRVTCTGTLYMCLCQEDAVDLREPLRRSTFDGPLIDAIRGGIRRKPKGHDFVIARSAAPATQRHMNATGG